MLKVILIIASSLYLLSTEAYAVPAVTGQPVVVQHLGKVEWPQDNASIMPSLTQLLANDINDLHGELSCELIISTPGNYHMALKDAMYGRADLGHIGLLRQQGVLPQFKVSICWSTSPPISIEQISAEKLQFKNIKMVGLPALAMAPGSVMNTLIANGQVDGTTSQPFLTNQGNVILVRNDKAASINNICDLGGSIRVVTPHPDLESGSFGNFSGTLFNIASQNTFGCDATTLFNSIFTQDLTTFNLSVFNSPYNINGVLSVFGRGPRPQGTGAKWVASSRIMHRDVPYALCNDEADAAVIFYHQATYLKRLMASRGCRLEIIPLGGTVANPVPLPGNKVGTLHIAKVNGSFSQKVSDARDIIYNFLTTDPVWEQILNSHGMVR